MAGSIEQRVREIAERVARDYGLEIVEVELRGGGKSRRLRITIDREPSSVVGLRSSAEAPHSEASLPQSGGVTHEDCADVSREVSTILDVEDVVPGASYTLEVTSPGLDRKLVRARDWERFVGSRVKLVTREAVAGQKAFEGRLEKFADGRLTLELKTAQKKKGGTPPSHQVEIEFANIDRANLVPEFCELSTKSGI